MSSFIVIHVKLSESYCTQTKHTIQIENIISYNEVVVPHFRTLH